MALVLKQLSALPREELAIMREERERFLAALEPVSTAWTFNHDQG